jgi:TolB-like protein
MTVIEVPISLKWFGRQPSPATSTDALMESPAPDTEEVLAALAKLVASKDLDVPVRSRRLLEYVVREAIAGRGDRIKAYSIATEVFGRPSTFDPQKDPIVRIEAAKLRRAIEHYYLTEGKTEAVVIEIPKGGYAPTFRRRTPELEGAPPTSIEETKNPPEKVPDGHRPLARRWIAALSVLAVASGTAIGIESLDIAARQEDSAPSKNLSEVLPKVIMTPLQDLSPSEDSSVLSQGISESIIEKTTRFKDIVVVAGSMNDGSWPSTGGVNSPRYEFGGTLRMSDDFIRVQTRLVDRIDGTVIWAESFNVSRAARQLFDVEVEIANRIATELAEPRGAVFEAERRLMADRPPENWTAYSCTLRAYVYRATLGLQQFTDVRTCLERAVQEAPDYATAWALLSLTYLDEVRFFYPPPPGVAEPALDRSFKAARTAIDLDPSNVRGQQALMTALFLKGETAAALDVGKNALTRNPNDVELKGEYGTRLAFSGRWDAGCNLLGDALEASSRKIAYYKTILALCSFFKNDNAEAAQLIRDAEANNNPGYHIIAAAILAEAGHSEWAASHRTWLEQNVPDQLPALLSGLPSRLVQKQDRQRFINSLRKAGLVATP